MNLNNFTLKAQEAVQKAFQIAEAKGQQAIECAHLLHGVISEAESITDWLFGKIGVSSAAVLKDIEKLIEPSQGYQERIPICPQEHPKLSEKPMTMLQR